MKRIINVVEDEKDLNELVKSYLEKEGYSVNSYYTFDSAYSHIDDYCDLWKTFIPCILVRFVLFPQYAPFNWLSLSFHQHLV